ncbi:flagellar hook-basal body complex protein FliE [Rhizobiaceae bacterium n13]|uniref:Flagellar hook-basal body complex protein FliE n=1 Tax=Ferirhizobium litorale TaxID=2927786 RepID=A0AAE3QFP6_9HYPH|nr:flagellar hook-basal body complex protein FliE [Fererhizobium litorale]MDI7863399.1 flagellar hook-basal body complex protein FliE [Fererhizobium litorale]MDI7922324.1 flagellar hook-basal body complex protein FliE [Fererhizobium litorale]
MIDSIKNVSSLSLTRGLNEAFSSNSVSATETPQLAPGENTGLDFASVIGGMAKDAVNNIKQAEISSFQGLKGQATTREVVDAVLNAEQSLQTAMALRDKIVSAYLEITKMQI